MIEIYSSISIILGFTALLLPLAVLPLCNKISYPIYTAITMASFISCAFSICVQLFSTSYSVNEKDWSSLLDIAHGMAIISVWLASITSVINIVVSLIYFSNKNSFKS
jgi:ABC-type spermidine/putrescine transport system permease subunit I